jgi:hypothetical protein
MRHRGQISCERGEERSLRGGRRFANSEIARTSFGAVGAVHELAKRSLPGSVYAPSHRIREER